MLPPVLQHYRQAAEPGLQWRQTQEHERRPTQVKYIFILLTVFPFGWPTLMPHLQWFPIFRHSKPIFIQYKVNSIEAAAVSATLYCRCDPPCVPYLGIYLSDLTYIEEGTANFTESGLVNFAKMRMVNRTIFIWSPGWKNYSDCTRDPGGAPVPADSLQDWPHPEGLGLLAGPHPDAHGWRDVREVPDDRAPVLETLSVGRLVFCGLRRWKLGNSLHISKVDECKL